MASRPNYVNPISMGLLGGVTNWANEMEKYNLLNAQNNARQQAYATKYSAMANVSKLREQNNAMIAKMKVELGQKQYTNVLTDGDGNKVVSMGHMIADPNNPDQFVPHEDTRMSLDEYNKFKGGGRTANGAGAYTLSPGQKRLDASGNVIAENPKGADPQAAMADRQAAREKAIDARTDKSEQRRINSEAARSTNAAMREFDKATPEEQAALAKSMGLSPTVADPDAKTLFGNPKEGATKPNDALRKQYRDAVHKQALEESTGSPSEGGTPAETGDTTSEPDTHVPDIRTGADGKQYKVIGTDPATGKVQAVPLAMDTVDTGDAVAQGPDDENEPAPDEEDSGPDIKGLLEQYGKQNDNALAQQQSQMAGDDDSELEPEQDGILAG